MSKLFSKQNGLVLAVLLLFSSALLLLGSALLSYSLNEMIIAAYQEEEIRLYYIAEAGLEVGLAALRRDFTHRERITGTLNGGTFQVDFTAPSPLVRRITSAAILGRYHKTLALIAEQEISGQIRDKWIK